MAEQPLNEFPGIAIAPPNDPLIASFAQDRDFQTHLTGVSGSGAGTEVAIENIWALYFTVSGDHQMAVGDRISVHLPQIGELNATIIWDGPQILGCRLTKPLALDGVFPEASLPSGNAMEGSIAEQRAASFGSRFIEFRKLAGLTQTQLAALLGVSVPAICAWEKNKSRPKIKRLEQICIILGISVEELVGVPDGPSLRWHIRHSRHRIAQAAGVSPDRVEISIKL